MAKKDIKITKAELEQDELLEFTDHLIFFLKTHGSKLLLGIAAIFAIYGGIVVMKQREESKLRAASDDLFRAILHYETALSENPFGSAARVEALGKVAMEADNIVAAHGNTPLTRSALYLKGNALYFSGDQAGKTANTEKAIEAFNAYERKVAGEGDEFERAAALLALGYAHENLHLLVKETDPQAAEKALTDASVFYVRIMELKDAGFLRHEAMNANARLLRYRGETDKAMEIYRTVVKEAYRTVAEPENRTSQRDSLLYQVRLTINQFTTGATAKAALVRMGMKAEDVDKLADGPAPAAG